MNIIADASLPDLENAFPKPFNLTLFHNLEELQNLLANQEILLCRSTLKVSQSLIENSALRFIATASSGIDHVDKTYLDKNNIRLFDAKGANASSVADYVLSCIVYLQTQTAITGKKAGIIGYGAVGTKVAEVLLNLGFDCLAYDPPKAMQTDFTSASLEEILDCDLICIHANLHETQPYPTQGFLDAAFFNQLKPQTVIINAARGGIVDEQALLACKTPLIYCTDVYANEPKIDPKVLHFSTLCTPSLRWP